ncbi:phosphoglycerate kinase [Thermodesulfovibrio sp.]|uniref:phosphoglycerate kinase n=1 Tax=Thermodesulfovibrio sp. TaxID=2067987 RepID=UPI003D14D893
MCKKPCLSNYSVYKLKGKRVFVRADLNDPVNEKGELIGDMRIRATLPTIGYLVGAGAKVIVASHMGRPKDKEAKYSLCSVKKYLSKTSPFKIHFVPSWGDEVKDTLKLLKDGEILLLQNLRFHPGETSNDEEFAKFLASLADIYVFEAFGTAHRKHASVVSLPKFLPSMIGFLTEKEINTINGLIEQAKKPFLFILGGKKISDKIRVFERLLDKAQIICIGGAMACTFFKALGYQVGKSFYEEDSLDVARAIMKKAEQRGCKLLLPQDVMVAKTISDNTETKYVSREEIPEDYQVVDIGPKTFEIYKKEINSANTILWNGPMGIYEIPKFSWGSKSIALTIGMSKAIKICGGGDTAEVLNSSNLISHFDHISTGGGAFLKFLEGSSLPALEAIS